MQVRSCTSSIRRVLHQETIAMDAATILWRKAQAMSFLPSVINFMP